MVWKTPRVTLALFHIRYLSKGFERQSLYLGVDDILILTHILNRYRIAFMLVPYLHICPLLSFSDLNKFWPKSYAPRWVEPRRASPNRLVNLIFKWDSFLYSCNLGKSLVKWTKIFKRPRPRAEVWHKPWIVGSKIII
jgi:hypothetical protein